MDEWLDYRSIYTNIPRIPKRSKLKKDMTFVLSEEEKHGIFLLLTKLDINPYIKNQSEDFIHFSEVNIFKCLNESTIKRIKNEIEKKSGVLLLKNLPLDSISDTPKKIGALEPSDKETFISEFISIGLGKILGGDLFTYRQEGYGSSPIIDNIVPMKNLKKQKGAGGYHNNFPFHVESGWHNKRVDFLVLCGIRGDKKTKTLLFSSDHLSETLNTDRNLRKPLFRLKAPQIYLQMEENGMPMRTPHSKICKPIEIINGTVQLNLNFNGMDCKNLNCADSLYKLETYIEENAMEHSLNAGECLIFNNSKICHTRNGAEPIFDGNQRWIQRSYYKKNLWGKKYSYDEVASSKEFIDAKQKGWIQDDLEVTSLFLETPELADNKLSNFLYQFLPSKGERVI